MNKQIYIALVGVLTVLAALALFLTFGLKEEDQQATLYYVKAEDFLLAPVAITLKKDEGLKELMARYISEPAPSGMESLIGPGAAFLGSSYDEEGIIQIDVNGAYFAIDYGIEGNLLNLQALVHTVLSYTGEEEVRILRDGVPGGFLHNGIFMGNPFPADPDVVE